MCSSYGRVLKVAVQCVSECEIVRVGSVHHLEAASTAVVCTLTCYCSTPRNPLIASKRKTHSVYKMTFKHRAKNLSLGYPTSTHKLFKNCGLHLNYLKEK